jgi:hypothetical protein
MNLEKNEVGEIVQRNPDGTLKPGTRLNPHGAGAPGKRIWDEFQKTVDNKLSVFLDAFVNGFSDKKKGHVPTKEHYLESDKALEAFIKFKPKDEEASSGILNLNDYKEVLEALLAQKEENEALRKENEALKAKPQYYVNPQHQSGLNGIPVGISTVSCPAADDSNCVTTPITPAPVIPRDSSAPTVARPERPIRPERTPRVRPERPARPAPIASKVNQKDPTPPTAA